MGSVVPTAGRMTLTNTACIWCAVKYYMCMYMYMACGNGVSVSSLWHTCTCLQGLCQVIVERSQPNYLSQVCLTPFCIILTFHILVKSFNITRGYVKRHHYLTRTETLFLGGMKSAVTCCTVGVDIHY